jgi:GNAT superfamily N-acetyltransferase
VWYNREALYITNWRKVMETIIHDLGTRGGVGKGGLNDKIAALQIFWEKPGERSCRAESYQLGNWEPTADEMALGPNTTLSDGIYIVTVSDETPKEWLAISRKASMVALGDHPEASLFPSFQYDSAVAVYSGRVVGGVLARVGRQVGYRWKPVLKEGGTAYTHEELYAGVERPPDCPPLVPDPTIGRRPLVNTIWVHQQHRRLGIGRQLISALARHFTFQVDDVAYQLPLSVEATLMFQAMGVGQIICNI